MEPRHWERYWIKKLIINTKEIGPNENPNIALSIKDKSISSINFDYFRHTIEISTTSSSKPVTLIRDPSLSPSEDNRTIGLSCFLCITNDKFDKFEDFYIYPFIERNKKLGIFPGKLSFVGGLFEPGDITFEHTVLKSMIKSFSMDNYTTTSNNNLLTYIKNNLSLTHIVLSHPLIDKSRIFNITIVYSVVLSNRLITEFDHNCFITSEAEKIVGLKGLDIFKSLIDNCPFENAKGWTPNSAIIVIDYLKKIADNQRLIRQANLTEDELYYTELLEYFICTETCQTTEKDLKNFLKFILKLLYDFIIKKKEQPNNTLLPPPLNVYRDTTKYVRNYQLDTLKEEYPNQSITYYNINKINSETSTNVIAHDMIAMLMEFEVYSMRLIFIGYESGKEGYSEDNKIKEEIFMKILIRLKTYYKNVIDGVTSIDYLIDEYGVPVKAGWRVTLMSKKK
jgi:hypothetical protein